MSGWSYRVPVNSHGTSKKTLSGCHQKEFLLKFARDKRRLLQWLYQARKRYGVTILNYIVTSNHVHLLVMDDGGCKTIKWTKSIAVGSREFINRVQINLGGRASGRKIQEDEVGYQLREPSETYSALSEDEKDDMSSNNTYILGGELWNIISHVTWPDPICVHLCFTAVE